VSDSYNVMIIIIMHHHGEDGSTISRP